MKKLLGSAWDGLAMLWEDSVWYLQGLLYTVAIIFLIIGVVAVITGAPGLGIVLIALNALFIAIMLKLHRKANESFDREFEEMVRQNLEDQNSDDGGRTK